jgi:hypothetical protein
MDATEESVKAFSELSDETWEQFVDINNRVQSHEGYDSTASQPLTQAEKDSFGLVIAYVSGVCAIWHAAQGTEYTEPYLEFGEEQLKTQD